ncbi:MAG: nucleotidyltransferase domain-containing protein [Alphaproteobacteria bacterium]|nr:nucleotidyltransferase domain-containing protein [Alphaproteobacteria bacterium]
MVVVAPEEDPKLRKLVEHVVRVMEPLEVWLFGSRAEGRARPESDYDILVIVPDDALDEWLDPRRTWQVGHDAGVIADIIPCTKRDFDEEKDEIDTLPRAAYTRGMRLYAA